MFTLDNEPVTDAFPLDNQSGGAQVVSQGGSNGGFANVKDADVMVQIGYYLAGGLIAWTPELRSGVGNIILEAGTAGIRFRNATAGVVATVSAALSELSEPPVRLVASGEASPTPTPSSAVILDRSTGLASFANTVAEQTMYSFSIPAGTLNSTSILRLTTLGSYRAGSVGACTWTWRLKLGGVTVWAATSNDLVSSLTDGAVFFEVVIQCCGSLSVQSIVGHGGMSRATALTGIGAVATLTGTPTYSSQEPFGIVADSTVDMSLAQTLAITAQMSLGNNNNITRQRSAFLELL